MTKAMRSNPSLRDVMMPGRLRVGPGKTVGLTVEFDPSEQPDFRGRLAVAYVGTSLDGVAVLRGRVEVNVVDTSASADVACAASFSKNERLEPRQ